MYELSFEILKVSLLSSWILRRLGFQIHESHKTAGIFLTYLFDVKWLIYIIPVHGHEKRHFQYDCKPNYVD